MSREGRAPSGWGWPGGRRFAFTILDDTDVASVENVGPLYDLLASLGMRTTKTVWPLSHDGPTIFAGSSTLADPEYRDWIRALEARGFEIGSHGASMESSPRDRTIEGHAVLRRELGRVPRVHANHSINQENVYWGQDRVDDPIVRFLVRRLTKRATGYYAGHDQRSPYWWGDVCREHHAYVRNLTFEDLNALRHNPSMPYHDPSRPHVRAWFSTSDADDADAFVELLTPARLARLEAEGGACIVSTHLGKRFVQDGRVRPDVRRVLEDVAARPGWFVPVGELLDHLAARRGGARPAPGWEWRRMQWRWAYDLAMRNVRARRKRMA